MAFLTTMGGASACAADGSDEVGCRRLILLRPSPCLLVTFVTLGEQCKEQRNGRELVVDRLGDAYRRINVRGPSFSDRLPGPPLLVGSDELEEGGEEKPPVEQPTVRGGRGGLIIVFPLLVRALR